VGSRRGALIALNAVGGAAVLLSYWVGLSAGAGEALWGGVPERVRPLYTLNMVAAAAGYFLFTPYIVFRRRRRASPRASTTGSSWSSTRSC
jgi:hypothetical protein